MSLRKSGRLAAIAIGTVLTLGATAHAQTAPAKSHQLAYLVDSGMVQNNGLIAPGFDAKGQLEASVVFVHEIDVPDAQWLRLQFEQVLLSGDKATNNASYLVITSMWDGASQRLYTDDVFNWNNTSAYLNGGTLIVELYAYPGTGPNRFVMRELTVGEVPPGGTPIDSICGPTDDRTLSQDNRQGRLWPIGCTAWLIEDGDFGNRFLTAGHCISNSTNNAVMQFNVPLSTAGGTAQHPPPDDQWPVPAGQINSNGGQGTGNDYAQFFTAVNGTGLTPREANGGGAYRLAATAPPVSGQSIRVTGYGSTTTQPNTPRSWSLVQKTHTGPFVTNSGTLIRYAMDTTGGNSGSPVVDVTGGGLAIGIHTHAGCSAQGGSNQGTDISHSGLQNFLSNPAGTGIPMNDSCVTTTFASNNSGADGGAVYFDIVTNATAVRITGLQMNVDVPAANFGEAFSVDVYTTSGTFDGKETNQGLWTQVAVGTGTVGQRDSASMVTLDQTIALPANATTGIALVLSSNTGHNYTNGNGSNQSYTDGTITVNLGSASNVPFTAGIFNPRVFNGTICYEPDVAEGQCIETIFASNNGGNVGGAVYFDASIGNNPVLISGLNLNTSATAGDPIGANIYITPNTAVGKQTNMALWTQVSTGSGTSAGTDGVSQIALEEWFTLDANTSYGIAIVMIDGGHRYTNGNGSNQAYSNSDISLSLGSASNVPFTAGIFNPRVFNGSLCYTLQPWCPDVVTEQSPPNPLLTCRNSNTANGGISNQQIADDFTLRDDAAIDSMMLWAVYTGDNSVPATQDFVINIYDDNAGDPGNLVYTQNVVGVSPELAGPVQTGFTPTRNLYQFSLNLATPFNAIAGERYWLSALGDTPDKEWCWQFFASDGTRKSRSSGAANWITLSGSLSFRLCGTVQACPCACNFDTSTGNNVCDIFDFLAFQNAFVGADPCACDIDTSTGQGVCDIFDFLAFQNAFVAGCP